MDKEIFKKVQRIQITSRRMVNDILAGEYHSVFKGMGIEFEEVREYQLGDDIRAIDWNVTARTGKPHIKKFVEERELTVMLMVDASRSGFFGTQEKFKNELAAEMCAVLAFSAIKNNDKVGLMIFTDEVELFIPPKKGKGHVLRVIKEILSFHPKGKSTNIAHALEYLNSILKRRAVTFLVSDFIDQNYEHALRITNKRHDLIAISLDDERDLEIPDVGLIEMIDPESGESVLVDTASKAARKHFREFQRRGFQERELLFKSCNVDEIRVRTGDPYIKAIRRFFSMRESRR